MNFQRDKTILLIRTNFDHLRIRVDCKVRYWRQLFRNINVSLKMAFKTTLDTKLIERKKFSHPNSKHTGLKRNRFHVETSIK